MTGKKKYRTTGRQKDMHTGLKEDRKTEIQDDRKTERHEYMDDRKRKTEILDERNTERQAAGKISRPVKSYFVRLDLTQLKDKSQFPISWHRR